MRGRGCVLVALLLSTPASANTLHATPSGQDVTLTEVLLDENPGALWVRFRFLAPQIARAESTLDFDAAVQDMQHLCDQVAVPYIAELRIEPERIVVSLSDRSVAFGQSDPDATQFFELFSLENGACIWEEF